MVPLISNHNKTDMIHDRSTVDYQIHKKNYSDTTRDIVENEILKRNGTGKWKNHFPSEYSEKNAEQRLNMRQSSSALKPKAL